LCLIKTIKEISNSCVILRYLQLFEENKKFIEIGGSYESIIS